MKCLVCRSRNAAVFVGVLSGEVVRTVALCTECSRKKSLPEALRNFLPSQVRRPGRKRRASACEFCGHRRSDFRKHAYVGCADCYEFLEPDMTAYLRMVHGTAVHRGRAPESGRAVHAGRAARTDLLGKILIEKVARRDFVSARRIACRLWRDHAA